MSEISAMREPFLANVQPDKSVAKATGKQHRTWHTILSERVDGALAVLENAVEGVPWPWANLTANTDTICEGDLIVVVAHTGAGKTTFLQNLLVSWAGLGLKILYFGTEQSVVMLTLKWACMMAGIPFRDARRGRVEEGSRQKINDALAQQRNAPHSNISFYPNPSPTTKDLETAIRTGAKSGYTVFMIDYLGRIDLPGDMSEWQETKALMRMLKNLAVELRVRIIAAAQANGNPLNKLQRYYPPDLDNIQGGKVIGREADIVIGVYQPLMRGLTEKDKQAFIAGASDLSSIVEPHTADVVTLKHREDGAFIGKHALFWVEKNTFSPRDSKPIRNPEKRTDPAVVFQDEEPEFVTT